MSLVGIFFLLLPGLFKGTKKLQTYKGSEKYKELVSVSSEISHTRISTF